MESLFTIDSAAFFLIGAVSMLVHAVKKWAMREIRGNVIDWYLSHPRASVLSAMTMLGGIATAVLSGAISDSTAGAHIIAAWGIGYAADTVNNQGVK